MEYIEVIEEVIPYIIDQALKGLADHIITLKSREYASEWSLKIVQISSNQMRDDCVEPMSEDLEPILKIVEQRAPNHLKQIPTRIPSPLQIQKQFSSYRSNSKSFRQTKFQQTIFDQVFKPEITALPNQESPNDDDQLRMIKRQQQIEAKRQQQQLILRQIEANKLKELHRKLQQNLNKKEFTYDYNCEPLVKRQNKNNPQLITQVKFSLDPSKKVKQIKQKNRSTSLITDQSIRQQRNEIQIQLEEEYDGQTSNIPFIQLKDGVMITEKNKQLIGQSLDSPIKRLKKREYQQLDAHQQITHFIEHINFQHQTYRPQRQQRSKDKIQIHNQESVQQNLLKLPAIKSRSNDNKRSRRKRSISPNTTLN